MLQPPQLILVDYAAGYLNLATVCPAGAALFQCDAAHRSLPLRDLSPSEDSEVKGEGILIRLAPAATAGRADREPVTRLSLETDLAGQRFGPPVRVDQNVLATLTV